MKIYCVSINNFVLIPVTRFIIDFFAKNYYTTVIECQVKSEYSFQNIKKYYPIGKFETPKSFSNQKFYFKIYKYLFVYWQLLKISFQKKTLIYTQDYQVLSFAIFLKKILNKKDLKIFYNQFEMIEEELLTSRDKKKWLYCLKNSSFINLSIFPEQNRLEYFINITKIPVSKTLVFTNTCQIQNQKTLRASPYLQNIPEDALLIGHIGQVGQGHYYQQFINIIEACKGQNIFFLIAGRYDPVVLSAFKKIKNANVILLESLPHRELDNIYPFLDIGFILYKGVDRNFEYCAPNKLYEYWSYGVRVFAHPLKGLTPIFTNKILGALIDFENPNELIKVCEGFKKNDSDKAAIKNYFKNHLNVSDQINGLNRKIKEIENEQA